LSATKSSRELEIIGPVDARSLIVPAGFRRSEMWLRPSNSSIGRK
jgi:hypothetical protein